MTSGHTDQFQQKTDRIFSQIYYEFLWGEKQIDKQKPNKFLKQWVKCGDSN